MTQQATVLNHLKGAGITSMIAFHEYNITRLADVVFKLKGKGHKITTQMVPGRHGGQPYARYSLTEG